MTRISPTVDGTMCNGTTYEDEVETRLLRVHHLRDRPGLTGTPIGCDTTHCGTCAAERDGESVENCSVPAVQADGGRVTAIQGPAFGASRSSRIRATGFAPPRPPSRCFAR